MRIDRLILPASNVSKSIAFFGDLLDLPTTGSSIQVGWSEIRLVAAGDEAPRGVHLAFNVAYERFGAAMAWLKDRAPLQKEPDGDECVQLEGAWQSKSVYFEGPDRSVLELIGRRRHVRSASMLPFGGGDLYCLSEVGLPTDDVAVTVDEFTQTFGIPTLAPASSGFAAIGDDEGLLIAVAPNRPWFPERRQLPSAQGLEISLQGVQASGTLSNAAHGWTVHAA